MFIGGFGVKLLIERLFWLAVSLVVIFLGAAYIWHVVSGLPPETLYTF